MTKAIDSFNLVGQSLNGGWEVVEALQEKSYGTGGNFSVPYLVSKNGQTAFLKIIDIREALRAPDSSAKLKEMIDTYEFEKRILDKCKGLSRVVTILEYGEIKEGAIPLYYLIFEYAVHTARGHLLNNQSESERATKSLEMLHHAATGLMQLHSKQVSHQDLKPSNILLFPEDIAKIGDLGRSIEKGTSCPHDGGSFSGDWTYAPLEHHYGYDLRNWGEQRVAADLYMLGSLIPFFLLDRNTTSCVLEQLPSNIRPVWNRDYATAIPYITQAINNISDECERELTKASVLDDESISKLLMAFKQLSNPEPRFRGHPKSHTQGNPYSLERYVSLFNLLSIKSKLRVNYG